MHTLGVRSCYMELKKITYFLRIVEYGSLSKAAQSLYLTQPSLSRFLEKLEEDVGVKLFTRSKSSALVLTEAGKAYLRTAQQIHALWKALDAELSPIRKDENQIIFGIYGDFLHGFATECAEKVTQRFPNVSVKFFCDGSQEVQTQVAEGTLHLGLCAYEIKNEDLTYIPCAKKEMLLVTAKNHPLALSLQEGQRIRLHDLKKDTPFALMRKNTVLRETVDSYFHKLGYTPNIKRTYMRHGSIADVLCGSDTLGFCPENNLSDQLAYIPVDPPFYYRQGICYPKNTELSPAEKYLISLLKNQPEYRILD